MHPALLVIEGLKTREYQKADDRRRFTKCLTSVSAVALTREPVVVVLPSTDVLPPNERVIGERVVRNIGIH